MARLNFDTMNNLKPNPTAGPNSNGLNTAGERSQSGAQWHIVLLPVNFIGPNPFQPRTAFDEAEMLDLTASVRAHGVLQPVTVRTAPQNEERKGKATKKAAPRYQLIAGERRLRACHEAGRKVIPAIVRDDLTDAQAAELAIVENVQRANLNVMEEASAYKRLMLNFRMKEERIAKKVGKSAQTVRDMLRLLILPQEVQTLLASKKLTASHGQQLIRIAPFERVCTLVANAAVKDGLTATSLGQNLLPNARELREKKLIAELDFRTKFDWKEQCGACPHKAYFVSGYSSYCLKPVEWTRKQSEAVERQKQEAARVLDEAKVRGKGDVDTHTLPSGSYRDLSYAEPPAGCCETCPCRGAATDSRDPTKKKPVCLDPDRFTLLVKAEREAHEEARRRYFTGLWQEAKIKLETEMQSGNAKPCAALALLPLLSGTHLRYGETEAWRAINRQVASELSLDVPWHLCQSDETTTAQVLEALQSHEPHDLLRFVSCLLLAQEALQAVRYGGETPLLSAVLGHQTAIQNQLPCDDIDSRPFEEDGKSPSSP